MPILTPEFIIALKAGIAILFLFSLFNVQAQNGYFRTFKFGWTDWKYDTTYYESGVIMEIRQSKRKRKTLGSTTNISRVKRTLYDTNGRWYFKERYRINCGCFHNRVFDLWKRERSRSDDTAQVRAFYEPIIQQVTAI